VEKVKKPSFKIVWNSKDVTKEITHITKSVVYEDALEEESDTIEIICENSDRRWLYSWYPQKGDFLEVWIGYEGEQVKVGKFELDEFSFEGGADGEEISIRGIATVFKKALRQKNTKAWENTTLNTIVREIAKKHGLKARIEAKDIQIERVDQRLEGDWEFLKRLAKEYAKVVKIEGDKLVWTDKGNLRESFVISLTEEEILSYTFTSRKHSVYKGIILHYYDKKKKKLLTYKEDWEGHNTSADYLKVIKRFESLEQAKAYAKSMKEKYAGGELEGRLTVTGNPLLLAGNKLRLKDFGKLSGEWLIKKSIHRLDKEGGYVTEVEIKKI